MTSNSVTKTLEDNAHPYSEKTCFICADHRPKYWVVSECGHGICWMCSLRLRVLYEKTECPMCKVNQPQAFMGLRPLEDTFAQHFSKYAGKQTHFNKDLEIAFESEDLRKEAEEMLRIKCPFKGCKANSFPNKADLRRHTSTIHNLLLCDICLAHKKVFTRELGLYSSGTLAKHHKVEHPTCKLCGTHFFSDDEITEHYRDKHERCHICYKASPSSAPYYRDYYSLVLCAVAKLNLS